jgi:hypothetical protein
MCVVKEIFMTALGIDETMDVLEAIQAQADAIIAACEDQKLTLLDLRYLFGILDETKSALVDAQKIPLELKDLDEDEIKILYEEIINLGIKVIEAFSAITKVVQKGG